MNNETKKYGKFARLFITEIKEESIGISHSFTVDKGIILESIGVVRL